MSTDIGIYGEELYEQVLPLHGPDPDGLARDYIGAIVSQALEIDDLARDDAQGRPGWGAILDVDECPIKGLPWLAQIAGVSLRDPKLVPGALAIPNANGELASTAGWASRFSDVAGTTTLTTATNLDGGGFHAHLTSAFPVGGDWQVIQPVAPSAAIPAIPDQVYGFSISLYVTDLITDAPGEYFWARYWFFDADFAVIEDGLLNGTDPLTTSDAFTVGNTATARGTRQAPAGTAYAGVGLILQNMGTGVNLNSQIDVGEAIVAPITAPDTNLVPAWPYVPALRLETEDEWAAYARDAIRRQGGKGRGTVDAILSAAEDTLIGTRTGRVLERVGGNAYALELITRPSETPDPAATLAAALTQKPAGMSLTHTLTEGVIIDEGTSTIDTATATIDTATLGDVT